MALKISTDINVDFYDKKYILINAKQLDRSSRYLSVTCYYRGNLVSINSGEHSAYIRYRKADENGVFNECEIDRKGKVLVELTEQMLASDGVCCADFVLVNKGDAEIDVNTGDVLYIDNASILSSMVFYIDVSEVAVNNCDIESSYEYNGLNTALQKAEAEYKEVIQLARSYAIGDADGIRENEDYDNAKYYYEESLKSASSAKTSETNASISEANAKTSETNAYTSETNAYTSEQNAKTSETNAKTSEQNAKISETNAYTSETNAYTSETNASLSEQNAKLSETNAKTSEVNSAESESNAKSSETNAKTSETKTNEYLIEVKNILNGINSGFIPMGTVSFSELATVSKATGYVYNINENFITDDTFREGAGMSYTVGTNVYYTGDGLWDCFGGSASVTATVDEVIEYLGI